MALIMLASGLGVVGYIRPVEAVQPSMIAIQSETIAPLSLPWPASGQAAVGGVGYGVVDEIRADKPAPIASTAKIITAMVVLEAKPLQIGQQGPNIVFSAQDEDIYDRYISRGGSVYPVTAGESVSQRQAMEALLIMSANNIADMLAVWAYGSMDAYVAAANEFVAKHGMDTMTIADASGFSPKTVATAVDLVRAGELLMDDPLLTGIVKQKSLTIPDLGVVPSTNVLLGDDVVGIKTGNTDEAGGCYVIAVTHAVGGSEPITIVAAVMGAKDVPSAMRSAQAIAQDARSGFASRTIVAANDHVATYKLPWRTDVQAVVRDDLRVVVWLPQPVDTEVNLSALGDSVAAGQALGTVSVHGQSVDVVAEAAAPRPPLLWRAYSRYF